MRQARCRQFFCTVPVELRQCPDGHCANERRFVFEQPLGFLGKRYVSGIADRDQHIAHEPVAPDPFDWRAAEQGAEISLVQSRQIQSILL